jgi:hypothetical protein
MPPDASPQKRRGDRHDKAKRNNGGRIRMTNKAIDSQRFSTVKPPRKNEVGSSVVGAAPRTLAPALRAGEKGRVAFAQQQQQQQRAKEETVTKRATPDPTFDSADGGRSERKNAPSSSTAFDPIPNDPTFIIIADSQYWPPPPIDPATLQRDCGLDQYNRLGDEATAKASKLRLIGGDLNHPRGRPPKNSKKTFDDDDDDDA